MSFAEHKGLLPLPCSVVALRSVMGLRDGGEDLLAAIGALERTGMSSPPERPGSPHWRIPLPGRRRPTSSGHVPKSRGCTRDTRRVYEELLGSAEHSIWASTNAFFDGPKAFQSLARRMDERPDVKVVLLLNIQRKRGDTSAADQLVVRFADPFWTSDWPGVAKLRVYYDPRSLEPHGHRRPPRKCGRRGRRDGVRHVGELHRDGAGPEHRDRRARADPALAASVSQHFEC